MKIMRGLQGVKTIPKELVVSALGQPAGLDICLECDFYKMTNIKLVILSY